MAVPYTFGAATAAIPLSNLDSNFATTITLGNTAIQLGNTVTTLNNMTLANVTVSSGSVTLTNVSATLANVTTANIGTAVITGTSTLTGLTASTALALDASKNIASVTNTGTGNNVLATSPTITTPTISSLTSAAATALTLQSAGTTAVTVDTSQNVGIGTTTLNGKLNVLTAADSKLIVNDGSTAGNVRLEAVNNAYSSYKPFETNGSVQIFATSATERMRIDSSGNVLVNATSTVGTGGKLQATSNTDTALFKTTSSTVYAAVICNVENTAARLIAFQYGSGTSPTNVGSITTNGTITSYNVSSDYRLKEDIVPMTGALEKVAALKPVTYKWKVDGSDGQGFIAHELAAVCPDAVTGEKDAAETVEVKDEKGNVTGTEVRPVYQGIDVSFLVATLTAAIQEQQALITSLTARIAALEAK